MNTKDMIRICEHNGWRVYKNDCSELIFEAVNDVGSYYHFYVRTNHIVEDIHDQLAKANASINSYAAQLHTSTMCPLNDCEMAARHIASKLCELYQILSATKN